jgi:acetamidase/formamidase
MSRRHEVFATPETVHWGYFDSTLKPILAIDPGDRIVMHSVFGLPTDMHPNRDRVPPELSAIHERVEHSMGPHILGGPFYVNGVEPGDVLVVDVRDVQLRFDWGHNRFGPHKGTLPEDFPKARSWVIEIDKTCKTAEWINGIRVPLQHPFFGIIGVAPPPGWGRISSRIPREHGGNIDNKELGAGATLYLPVFNEGALLSLGDGHAAQGDGEVDGTAVETGLTGEFEISVRRDIALRLPRAETPSHYITMGFDPDLNVAVKIALREMLDHMVTTYDLSREEAYSLSTALVDLRITQTVNGSKGVHAMLPKAVFEQARTPR